MDASHVALVALKLEIGLFESYRCDRTINLGLSLADLSKVLKCAKNEDTCMIRFDDGEGDNVTLTFEDPKCRKQVQTGLKYLELVLYTGNVFSGNHVEVDGH